jgi:hypothetical protein
MQNGNKLKDHISRFFNGGCYSKIEDYLIVDFHQHINDKQGFSKGFLHIFWLYILYIYI